MKIKDITLKNPVIVAPMAGICNPAFRTLLYQLNPGLVVSEMISDKAIYYGSSKTLDMTKVWENEHPLSMQLFGHDIETMVYAAKYLDTQVDCDIIDINMGCPVKKILAAHAGSALMEDVDYAYNMVNEVVKAVHKPVTVKMRIGVDSQHINCIQMTQAMEKAGVSAVCVHGRTRAQMYEGKANWDIISQVKQSVNIPVVGNGDINSVEMALDCLNKVDGIMIGRALLTNPWLIVQINQALNGQKVYEVSYDDKEQFILNHLHNLTKLYSDLTAVKQMRTFVAYMVIGLPNSKYIKVAINQCVKIEEFEALIHQYFTEIRELKDKKDINETSFDNN